MKIYSIAFFVQYKSEKIEKQEYFRPEFKVGDQIKLAVTPTKEKVFKEGEEVPVYFKEGNENVLFKKNQAAFVVPIFLVFFGGLATLLGIYFVRKKEEA